MEKIEHLKVGFISPLRTFDEIKKYKENITQPFLSLTVPKLIGVLKTLNIQNVFAWDCNRVLFDDNSQLQSLVKRAVVFEDQNHVNEFLNGENNIIFRYLDELLASVGIEQCDLFGFTLSMLPFDSYVQDNIVNFCLCFAKALKMKFPRCKIMIGGLQSVDETRVNKIYHAMLERCTELDVCANGSGELVIPLIIDYFFSTNFEKTSMNVSEGIHFESVNDKILISSKSFEEDRNRCGLEPFNFIVPEFVDAQSYRISIETIIEEDFYTEIQEDDFHNVLEDSILPIPLDFISGCSAKCSYCANSDRSVYPVDINTVVDTIEYLKDKYSSNYFIFLNSNINWSYDYAMKLSNELIRRQSNILWTDSLSLNNLDERLVANLVTSGFFRASVGVESGSDKILKLIKKPFHRNTVVKNLELLHKYGVWNYVNLIVGLPYETFDDIEQTISLIHDTDEYVDRYNVNQLFLISSSLLYRYPQKNNITIHKKLVETPYGYQLSYDETNGKTWEDIKVFSQQAYTMVTSEIEKMKKTGKVFGPSPFYLLFLLYKIYGHKNKESIRNLVYSNYNALEKRGGPVSVSCSEKSGEESINSEKINKYSVVGKYLALLKEQKKLWISNLKYDCSNEIEFHIHMKDQEYKIFIVDKNSQEEAYFMDNYFKYYYSIIHNGSDKYGAQIVHFISKLIAQKLKTYNF